MENVYIPLRLHSEYSIENGIVRIDDAADFAAAQGFAAMALTDAMNMFAMVKFYRACRKRGIKPIIGVDAEIAPLQTGGQPSRLLLLAKNHNGYLKLCTWLTQAYVAQNRGIRAQLSWEMLQAGENADLICLSGGKEGIVGQMLLAGKESGARDWAQKLAQLFPDAFYLEIQRLPEVQTPLAARWQESSAALAQAVHKVSSGSLKLAQELGLPPAATHPVQFMHEGDFVAHEARVCIAAGDTLGDAKRVSAFHPGQYFPDAAEMAARFADIPQALENTWEIARRCSAELTLGKHYLPVFPTPEGVSLDAFLEQEARRGLAERMAKLFPDENERAQKLPEYEKRLAFELDIIVRMGFPGYFLIVADFINWAKNNGCPVGPGRGSGAGSLVAYSLKITDLDPLRYALLFERFLNPERVSMPDFDVDFCQENRGRVIDYVRHKYGEDAVSQIVTFGTLSSRAVLHDVGRVLDIPYPVRDKLSKLIPIGDGNKPLSLGEAQKAEPEIGKLLAEEEGEEWMALACKLENLVRNTGMHAGGVLIAPGKLTDFCPVYKAADSGAVSVSMYDKDDVEAAGLVKFDFLGLRNLTTIALAEEFIRDYRGENIDSAHIALDDEAVYSKIFAAGNTVAVFQFESDGMKGMLQQAKPSVFEDLIALVSLYRPGPMDLIPSFIARKHGQEKIEYQHPLLESVLAPTYGVMVYQEQVMQAAQVCGGYTLGGADMLRRAMGKKKPEEMAKHRAVFVAGAAEKGIDEARANDIFNYMEKFAGYGFNKSHAAAYALISYQTAWLKYHYPAEFIAATMSGSLDDTNQLKILHDDAAANRITFTPPSVNHSEYRFIPTDARTIRYGLGAVKGVGFGAVQAIVAAREAGGAFSGLLDFAARIDRQVLNKRVLESLIRAGAFDETDSDRGRLFANVQLALDYAEQKENNRFQAGLFDEDDTAAVALKAAPPWTAAQRLAEEKEALGFYYSAHPFSIYAEEIRPMARRPLSHISAQDYRQWLAGFVTQVRKIDTKSGDRLVILTLEDETAKREIVIRDAEVLENSADLLHADQVLLCECKVSKDNYGGSENLRINVYKLMTPDDARRQRARALEIRLCAKDDIAAVAAVLQKYRDGGRTVPVTINYRRAEDTPQGCLNADAQWCIVPKQELIDSLQQILPAESIRLRW